VGCSSSIRGSYWATDIQLSAAAIVRLYGLRFKIEHTFKQAVNLPQIVWQSFGSWLRTMRPGIPPSEFVVATALRQRLPEFLLNSRKANLITKFILDRHDPDKVGLFRAAA
jgi:hypothetical protein